MAREPRAPVCPAPLSIASLGTDYALSIAGMPVSLWLTGEGTVPIPAGKPSVAIRLAGAPDSILEWNETVRFVLLGSDAIRSRLSCG